MTQTREPGPWPTRGDGEPPLVAVLGASGFVGSAVTAALARRPVRLRAVARRPVTVPHGAVAEVETYAADLTTPGAVEAAVADADAVVFLVLHTSGWRGADHDPASERTNVGVLDDLVRTLRSRRLPAPAVVFAGSTSQVGLPPRVPIDGTETDHPATAYDRQKQAAEGLLRAATAEGVLRGVSLRLPTIFGPAPAPAAPDRGVVAAMARRALADEPLTVWADGAVQRDLLYVDDVAEAFVAALHHADLLAGRHWPLGTGVGVSLRDLFGTIAEVVAGHTGRPPVPVVSVPPPAQATGTDAHSMVVDASAFRAATGWRPLVPLREALDRTVTALVHPTRTASASG
ncbi:NAD-dependent epimerase/dehydratase family protein [Micromonospora sp. NBC_01796]|uniref:NAD-dependent epimerase/dehydratase family protein n=1 Tax=Micromonospora sp. NBC_01796 TaxID=2975987 RepID=UPI002DD9F9D7|nr:NAD-dependent epimerase/dehydratase [Micromonospora sp. NBC_01796]WSA87499.1 NAD-dependent epimerase/dehydratase [Micromonospora sp. NBC_01796]